MSEEFPAGGPPPGYPPPQWAPPPRDPDATRRGIRAAVIIFAVAVGLHLLLLAGIKLSGNNENAWLFLPEGLLVILGGLVAAIIITIKLPVDSRAAFWIAGIACMFASAIVWGLTCAVAL